MALAQSEPKIVYRIAPPDAQALFCRRRHQPRRPAARQDQVPTQERADPRWSMKASTQLIDDFGGSGIPLRRAEKILTSLLTNTRLHFLETIGVFWTTEVVLRSALMSTHTLGTPRTPAKEVYGLRANVQAIFFRRRHQPSRPPLAKIRPGTPAPAMRAVVPRTSPKGASSCDFRTIQVYPKDLRALPGHPEPAVSWHSGFRGGAHPRS